jgi:hypothetical protein
VKSYNKWDEVKARFKEGISINQFDNYRGVMTCYQNLHTNKNKQMTQEEVDDF